MTARWQRELGAVSATAVAGGDINDAFDVRLSDGSRVFVKTRTDAVPGMYAAEAAGLAWLGAGGALRVPRVLVATDEYLALEWLAAGAREPDFDEAFGRGLAELHAAGAPQFGGEPNFLAMLAQDNAPASDWPTFWIERRLRPLARAAGLGWETRLDELRARPAAFGPPEPPARLHGDLWWGNVMAVDGSPVLIDPAVYGGHREVDLAMLALFGAVSARLIAAYEEISPLAPGWRERVPLWQLYPVLVHAVLFGGGYRAQAARLFERTLTSSG